jgi:predicted RNA-binding Zn ribbon-like protein
MVWPAANPVALQHALIGAAMQLLCSADVHRVKACDGCGWLFLDTSRAGARRWCSMAMCGARHKMRRYHQRHTTGVAR